jgi:hypothetical protein
MKRILRYSVLVDDCTHHFDLNGAIVHVDSRQPDVVEFWSVETGGPVIKREFTVVGTGHPYPDHWKHVGTALTADGALVWHLIEVKP